MTPTNGNQAASPAGGGGACEGFREDLARYVDGELHGEELRWFEDHLAGCTECQREVAIFRSLKGDLQEMGLKKPEIPGGSVWNSVNNRVARPGGWVFLTVGVVMYLAYAIFMFIKSPMNLFEKLAIGLVVIGFIVLLASVAYERIVDYRTDPYKGVEK